MSVITVRECDLDTCDARAEVEERTRGYGRPDGWVTAAGKQFCGWAHVAAYATQQAANATAETHAGSGAT